ncbi:MAG: hypothetical protein ACE5H1_08315, partial [Thermodesulfobacteriota bacterium]
IDKKLVLKLMIFLLIVKIFLIEFLYLIFKNISDNFYNPKTWLDFVIFNPNFSLTTKFFS